jgi:peptidoglycan/xylan/chitin deacetylase (PgdA/CDA1 family)
MTDSRRLYLVPFMLAIAAALLLLVSAPPPAASAATSFSVRLEAGPQVGVTFDTRWAVTSSRTVTLTSPVTVTASRRVELPSRGNWLWLTTGTLAGRWVRENIVAYVPGFVDVTIFSPRRSVTLRTGTWELYQFDAAGVMSQAHGVVLTSSTVVQADRAATIRGQRHVHIATGTWAGWWVPGTAASPTRVTCSAGSPPTATGPITVRSVPSASGRFALTFDMGGRLTPALSIIRYLELQRVCATVFPTGAAAATTTGQAVLAEVAAHPELFELGNHTQHHCDLVNGGGGAACPAVPTAAFVQSELRDADAVIAGLSGRHTNPYWRPPYGSVNAAVKQAAAAAGWGYTVLWSVDTIDWRPLADGGPTAADIAAKVIGKRTAGGISLMHLGGYETRRALPATIKGLRGAGYAPTSLSALYR